MKHSKLKYEFLHHMKRIKDIDDGFLDAVFTKGECSNLRRQSEDLVSMCKIVFEYTDEPEQQNWLFSRWMEDEDETFFQELDDFAEENGL